MRKGRIKVQSDRQRERVKIANLVARKPEIENICCICGKKGTILHNYDDPYYITFLCSECRKDPRNLILAEERRFDLRAKISKSKINVSNFTDQEVTRIVVGYMNNEEAKSIGEYCDSIKISRYQFNHLIDRYDELFPSQDIKNLIKDKSKRIQGEKILEGKVRNGLFELKE